MLGAGTMYEGSDAILHLSYCGGLDTGHDSKEQEAQCQGFEGNQRLSEESDRPGFL